MTRLILKNKLITSLILITAVYAVYSLVTYHSRQIKTVTRNIQKAIRNKDIDGILTNVHYDYLDDYGYRSDDIITLFESVFEKLEDINVIIVDKDISINRPNALVNIKFRVVATVEMGFRGYVLGNLNRPAEIDVHLLLSDRRWYITRVSVIEQPADSQS